MTFFGRGPPPGLVNLNTDGSALGNPGRIGAGGILRDCNGDLIHAFNSPQGVGTNNQADLEAACIGLAWSLDNGYSGVILEVD
ncbi:hypothetical protein MTR67_007055 [Solanum verrucosum]|uniref:RNase H type-1 domain-containing protein n=1 Tax=Solanum verrucosum TaxID=315347 RepID=A0AAF0Q1C3_SOLVR|nr:hypothetical protein MTR67_007055 [Solanum verrucosum]